MGEGCWGVATDWGESIAGDIPADRKFEIRRSCGQAHPRICATRDRHVRGVCLDSGVKFVDWCQTVGALFKFYMLRTVREATGQDSETLSITHTQRG